MVTYCLHGKSVRIKKANQTLTIYKFGIRSMRHIGSEEIAREGAICFIACLVVNALRKVKAPKLGNHQKIVVAPFKLNLVRSRTKINTSAEIILKPTTHGSKRCEEICTCYLIIGIIRREQNMILSKCLMEKNAIAPVVMVNKQKNISTASSMLTY